MSLQVMTSASLDFPIFEMGLQEVTRSLCIKPSRSVFTLAPILGLGWDLLLSKDLAPLGPESVLLTVQPSPGAGSLVRVFCPDLPSWVPDLLVWGQW